MALALGTRLGAYEILTLLGAGGMGEVYRARDTKLNRDVAPDGKRLIGFPVPAADNDTVNHMTFLFNFVDEIRRRAPAK